MEEVICMFILFLLNVVTLIISITIFADIDNIKYQPAKAFQVSDYINKFTIVELVINILTTSSSFLWGSLIVFCISFVLTLYNLKKFFNNQHKLYFSIGDENKTLYDNFSLRHKFKFMAYLLIVILSLAFVLIFLLLKAMEFILSDKNTPRYLLSWITYI